MAKVSITDFRASSTPKLIGPILEQVIVRLGLKHKLSEARALILWDEVVGDRISDVTSAVSMRRGKLFVTVRTAAWRNELMFHKADIIRRLNRRVGEDVVKDIVFLNERRS